MKPKPTLTRRYTRALKVAKHLHRHDVRKGTEIPYLAHLLSVSALVIEHGGTEDQAIAALLHDAAEDHGGQERVDKIRSQFGDHVADIVQACSDSLVVDSSNKRDWWPRKVEYIDHLSTVPHEALLVSVADKLHNARSILADYRRVGDDLWSRFNADAGRSGSLWYYTRLLETYRARAEAKSGFADLVDELGRSLTDICNHARSLGHDPDTDLQQAIRTETETRSAPVVS